MKNLFRLCFVSVSLLLATSCTEEELVDNNVQQQGNFTLEVGLGVDSRAYYEEQSGHYPIKWNETDQIYVSSEDGRVYGTLTLDKFTDETGQRATFKGIVFGNRSKLAYAVYPVPDKKTKKIDLTNRKASMPNPPMVGTFGTDKTKIKFAETTPAIQLTINNLPEGETLKVKADGISGTAKVEKGGDGKYGLNYTSDNKGEITITNLPGGNQTIYVPVITNGDTNEIISLEMTLTIGDATDTKVVKFFNSKVTNVANGNGFLNLTYIPATETKKAQLVEAWDGQANTSWYNDTDTEFTLSKASELAGLASLVNKSGAEGGVNFSGKTIKLAKSINLDGKVWTPIGKRGVLSFRGTFDGQGNTISNMIVSGGDAGLFGQVWGATIKNLNIENAEIESDGCSGAIIGYVHGSTETIDVPSVIQDVTVENTTINGQINEPLYGGISGDAVLMIISGSDEMVVSKANMLNDLLAKGGIVVLDEKITAAEPINVPEGVTVTLDLNGKKLSGKILAPNANLTVKNGFIDNGDLGKSGIEINAGQLTLDNVTVESARHAVRIDGDVIATINGGIFKGAGKNQTTHAVNVSGNAQVTINGGTFIGPKGTDADSGSAVKVQAGSTVTITGGDFSNGLNNTLEADGTLIVKGGKFDQNPAEFVASGFIITENGDDTYTVTPKISNNTVDVTAAIKAGDKNVTLAEDMALDSSILKEAKELTINLEANTTITVASGAMSGDNVSSIKDFTFTGDKSTTVKFENTNPGYEGKLAYHDNANLTFKGITFNASEISGICARGGVVTFEDCTVKGELEQTIASKFVFSGCTFTDGVTQVGYGCSDVVFENNCKFETDGYGIKIYADDKNRKINLTVTDCSFKNTSSTAKSAIFLDHIIEGITYNIIVEGCTFEGYTATPTPNENKWAARMIVEDSFIKTADGQYIFSYQTGTEDGNYHKILTDEELVVNVK